MCIKNNYNEICESNNLRKIVEFMDECSSCVKLHGGCDYLGYLDDTLVRIENENRILKSYIGDEKEIEELFKFESNIGRK